MVLPEGVTEWEQVNQEDQIKIQQRLKRALKLLVSPKPPDKGGYDIPIL